MCGRIAANSNVANIKVSFKYKTENMGSGNDIAFVQVVVYDTLAAGASDDVALYFDNVAYTADVTSWTAETLTLQSLGATGTPNLMEFNAVSSMLGTYSAGTPSVGGTLWLDEVVIGTTLSVDENTLTTSVYPNPANDVLNIVASEEIANVSILGLDGKLVATSATSTVNVADLISGMYIYQVTTTSGKVSRDSFMKK